LQTEEFDERADNATDLDMICSDARELDTVSFYEVFLVLFMCESM